VKVASLIINPISGTGADEHAAQRRRAIASEVARRCGCEIEVAVTAYAGHARILAAGFAGAGSPLVIAWGGDGTVNEVASALVHTDSALGIVPSGSGNGLATELRFPLHPDRAIEAALAGSNRRIDVGRINQRTFVNLAGIGFDGHVAHQFQRLPKGRRGGLPYLKIGLSSVWGYRPASYSIQLDEGQFETAALIVAFANSCQYGNNAVIAPLAVIDDGRLEVVVVKPWPAAANFLRLHHLFRRTAHRAPGVLTRSTTRARVTSSCPMEMHVDGESVEPATEAIVEILPGALMLRVPGGRATA
jgi:YegS/Rv2252/BmrU family lipid kinase